MTTQITTVSIYATDEEISVAVCDECYQTGRFHLSWWRFANLGERCAICGALNAVDVVRIDDYWQEASDR